MIERSKMVPNRIQKDSITMEVVDEEIAQIGKRIWELIAQYNNVDKLDIATRREFIRTFRQELHFEDAKRNLAQFL